MFIADSQTLMINIKDYGVAGDGVTDDTTAIQNALNAITSGTEVRFPAGTYIISSSILYPGNCKITGSGDSDGGTVLKVKTGTALTTPVLCAAAWYNNSATAGNPVEISDIQIDGNNATTGANAHGFVSMNFWSSFDRMTIKNVAGAGFLFTASSRNGTHISNTCVEPKIRRIQVRTCGGHGISVVDSSTPLTSCTDGFIEDCLITGVGARGINLNRSAGWYITGNHIYGSVTDAMKLDGCYATRVIGNYIDGFGASGSSFIAGILMNILDGRGSCCIGNHVGFEASQATSLFGININGNGTGDAVCVCMGNTVKGGNQTGSEGYLIQSNNASTWKCYFHDNDAKSVVTNVSEDNKTIGGDLGILGHIGSLSQNPPTAAAGANSGGTPPTPIRTSCTDTAGQITFGTGTTPAAGDQCDVTFQVAYASAPKVVLTPINSASAALNLYVSTATTGFNVSCVNAPAASQANTVYGFYYIVFL